MREQAFRAFLATRVGARTADSYIAYGRRVERVLHADTDELDLSDAGIERIGGRLTANGVPAKSTANCLSALRSYSALHRLNPA